MGELGNISGKEAAKAFGRAGWLFKNQIGSHLVMTKREREVTWLSLNTANLLSERYEGSSEPLD